MSQERGTVLRIFDRGFLFVRDQHGAEHFAHARQCEDFDSLKVNDHVTFTIGMGRNNRTCAEGIKRITTTEASRTSPAPPRDCDGDEVPTDPEF